MAITQVPGKLDIKISRGDDFNIQFNIPFDISDYSWTFIVSETNRGPKNIQLVTQATSSVEGIIQAIFPASTTSAMAPTTPTKPHTWRLRGTSSAGARTFIAGLFELA